MCRAGGGILAVRKAILTISVVDCVLRAVCEVWLGRLTAGCVD